MQEIIKHLIINLYNTPLPLKIIILCMILISFKKWIELLSDAILINRIKKNTFLLKKIEEKQ